MKVLIVDDNEDHLYFLEKIIEKMNFKVESAKNGQEALEKLKNDNFNMVISDILMPIMDGYQLCQTIRKEERLKDLLFIFYTATYTHEDDEKLAYKLGADKFLRKPLEPDKLIEIIHNLVSDGSSRLITQAKPPFNNENEVLQLYNQRLIKKIEKKLVALENSEEKFRKTLNRANFYKDLFTHDMSNILQNLLSSVELCDKYLEKQEDLPLLIQIFIIIKKQIQRGANLISNVRKLSQLEDIKTSIKEINLIKILKDSIKFVKRSYIQQDLNIASDFPDKQILIKGNNLVYDVFDNILNNAIIHNENSTIEISIKISEIIRENQNYVKIEFIDNGVGIEDDWKKIIFLRGFKEIKNLSPMGLGLSLVKKIIKSINGEIWVQDKIIGDYSKGSNFTILIPEVRPD